MAGYKSYFWSFGTTSFRTQDFNRTIEQQLNLLHEFWENPENSNCDWSANNELQTRYYNFMKEKSFVKGDATRKDKDAREKTSGLVDIGLISESRRLTEAGEALRQISNSGDFSSDNFLSISKDSFIYLKQMLKTNIENDGQILRPFIVLLRILSEFDYLTIDEFTYIVPLCIDKESTAQIIDKLHCLRKKEAGIDDIIVERLMCMSNYKECLDTFLNNQVTEDLICEIGINRKSRKYDKPYYPLYNALYDVYINKNNASIIDVFDSIRSITIGGLWKKYLFSTISETAIKRNPVKYLNKTIFDKVDNELDFKIAFFKVLHLFKAKATLEDYRDLNRRYLKTTDVILFGDGEIKLDIIPKYFFNSAIDDLFSNAFSICDKLYSNCDLVEICEKLIPDEQAIITGINVELGKNYSTLEQAKLGIEDVRYSRFNALIDEKFTDDSIVHLLSLFESRRDTEIRDIVTDNADVPTIFEYVLGILWYKVSERQGKILDYMKLSLDADLLPKTHAAGGEADIVYEYEASDVYPKHSMLLEATLADQNNQRRMEMEPVSRHLGQHLLNDGNLDSYCVFATNNLNINVISDFRGRKSMPYYDVNDPTRFVQGMKIIPLETSDLKEIVSNRTKYKQLYPLFQNAYESCKAPHEWYNNEIKKVLCTKLI